MNRFVTIFFVHAVLCLSANCLSQAKTSNENLSPEFTGQKYFESSGLYYFNNRYYDPALGRFLTPDPLQQYASPYSYADGDPLGRVDPSGLLFEGLAELASSAFRSLMSYSPWGATEELGEPSELRLQSDNNASRDTRGITRGIQRRSVGAVEQSVSQSASVSSNPSPGVEERSFQDPHYNPELEDHLQNVDDSASHRVTALRGKTMVPVTEGGMVATLGLKESRFINRFSRDSIEFIENNKVNKSDGSGYFTSDVIRDQWRIAAHKGNFLDYLPKKFILFSENSIGDSAMKRVMHDFGLRTTGIDSRDGYINTYYVEPIATTAEKANQYLSLFFPLSSD